MLFNSTDAAQLIQWLSAIPLIVGLREITTSILWAQDRRKITFISTAVSIDFAVCCHYILIPYLHLNGAVVGILIYGADRPLSKCLCAQKAAEMGILEQNGCMGHRHINYRHTAGLFVPDGRAYLFSGHFRGSNWNAAVWSLPPRLLQMVKSLG